MKVLPLGAKITFQQIFGAFYALHMELGKQEVANLQHRIANK